MTYPQDKSLHKLAEKQNKRKIYKTSQLSSYLLTDAIKSNAPYILTHSVLLLQKAISRKNANKYSK